MAVPPRKPSSSKSYSHSSPAGEGDRRPRGRGDAKAAGRTTGGDERRGNRPAFGSAPQDERGARRTPAGRSGEGFYGAGKAGASEPAGRDGVSGRRGPATGGDERRGNRPAFGGAPQDERGARRTPAGRSGEGFYGAGKAGASEPAGRDGASGRRGASGPRDEAGRSSRGNDRGNERGAAYGDKRQGQGGRSAGYEDQFGHPRSAGDGRGRGPAGGGTRGERDQEGRQPRGAAQGARPPRRQGEASNMGGQGFGAIDQRRRPQQDAGEALRTAHQAQRDAGEGLPVERAKKMLQRRGSDKHEAYAQSLREKRIETKYIGDLRIQKALALSGIGSRRDCDTWVEAGRVTINGVTAVPGARTKPGDMIRFDGRPIDIKWPDRLPRIVLYHKQEGELVSRDDPEGRTTVFDRLPKVQSSAWIAIGRLDFNTSGLLIFTTSGDLANRMMHPSFEVQREYAVRILGSLTDEQKEQLKTGITLDDGEAHFDALEDQGGEGKNHWYRVILREGRNREVRRMFEHFNLQVSRLMRVRFGVLTLPSRLKRGQYYELDEPEVLSVLKWAGLGMTGRVGTRR